jgi:PPOX class probable F420-dependent enzyme
VSRRAEIVMSDEELAAFLEEQRVVICATNGPDGWPHLMPLWYLVRGGELCVWTYASSQKVRNLERDPRATLSIEDGDAYDELRGVMLRTTAEIERDPQAVVDVGLALYSQKLDTDELPPAVRANVEHQSAKRVAVRFVEQSRVSWDHRKLAVRSDG